MEFTHTFDFALDDTETLTLIVDGVAKTDLLFERIELDNADELEQQHIEALNIEFDEVFELKYLYTYEPKKGFARTLMNHAINKIYQRNPNALILLNCCPCGKRLMNIEQLYKFYISLGFEMLLNEQTNYILYHNACNFRTE